MATKGRKKTSTTAKNFRQALLEQYGPYWDDFHKSFLTQKMQKFGKQWQVLPLTFSLKNVPGRGVSDTKYAEIITFPKDHIPLNYKYTYVAIPLKHVCREDLIKFVDTLISAGKVKPPKFTTATLDELLSVLKSVQKGLSNAEIARKANLTSSPSNLSKDIKRRISTIDEILSVPKGKKTLLDIYTEKVARKKL